MLIVITPEELESEFQNPLKMGYITSPHIDYATNAIHAWLDEKEVIIFRFKDYGWINNNQSNKYDLSAGSAGIIIKIIKSNIYK
jgi:hypothetical protein